jgi:hypothetical protein
MVCVIGATHALSSNGAKLSTTAGTRIRAFRGRIVMRLNQQNCCNDVALAAVRVLHAVLSDDAQRALQTEGAGC